MTPISVRPIGAVLVALLLSGCGGSSSGPGSYEELLDTNQALSERLDPDKLTDVMPTVGTATYSGATAFATGEGRTAAYILYNADLVSDLELLADFEANKITGSMTGFKSRDGRPVTGTVDLTNGGIAGNQLAAELSGTLLIDGTPVNFADGTMTGGFFEPDAGIVGGGLAAAGYTGVFVADKQ